MFGVAAARVKQAPASGPRAGTPFQDRVLAGQFSSLAESGRESTPRERSSRGLATRGGPRLP